MRCERHAYHQLRTNQAEVINKSRGREPPRAQCLPEGPGIDSEACKCRAARSNGTSRREGQGWLAQRNRRRAAILPQSERDHDQVERARGGGRRIASAGH